MGRQTVEGALSVKPRWAGVPAELGGLELGRRVLTSAAGLAASSVAESGAGRSAASRELPSLVRASVEAVFRGRVFLVAEPTAFPLGRWQPDTRAAETSERPFGRPHPKPFCSEEPAELAPARTGTAREVRAPCLSSGAIVRWLDGLAANRLSLRCGLSEHRREARSTGWPGTRTRHRRIAIRPDREQCARRGWGGVTLRRPQIWKWGGNCMA